MNMNDTQLGGRQPFQFRNPRQREIYENLLFIGSGPAAFYLDACRIMEEPGFQSTTHLVGHLMREIEDALRAVLAPISQLDERLSHKDQIRQICRSLGLEKEMTEVWLSLAGELHSLAHRRRLQEPRPVSEEFRKKWENFQDMLNVILREIHGHFLRWIDVLDSLLEKDQPTQEDVKLLANRIPQNTVTHGYFFDRLKSPEWIALLEKGGFFQNPPSPERNEVEGTIRFPAWPESRYLARMASKKPDLVLDVILKIPDTENVSVHADLVEAALNMPPDLAAKLVEKAKTWAQSPYPTLLPEKLGALMAHLAKGGKVSKALELAEVLLEISPDPRYDDASGNVPEPKARYHTWLYEEILKVYFPEVVGAAGIQALGLLCDLLETTICLRMKRDGERCCEDYSRLWRPAIEDHLRTSDIKNILVSAVRDAAVQLVQENETRIGEIVNSLEERSWWVFKRIALHLLRSFPEAAPDLVAERLTDRTLFDSENVRHEYVLLLDECFENLTEEQQRTILGWIEAGPDLQEFKEREEQRTGKRPSDEDAERYRKIWQRNHLAWIKAHLSEDWKSRYDSLVKEFGEPEYPEFLSYTTIWVGPTSPKDAEELRRMSVGDIIEFLETWKPSRDLMAPSPEGLGRVLTEVVREEPNRFASEASRFKAVDATYVRALLSGLREALEQNRTFEWDPVLELCNWVVRQPREIPGRDEDLSEDIDPHWGWARKTVADLLSEGFQADSGTIPVEYRERVWGILKPLTSDPDPTPEYEAQYDGTNIDPATMSINTTRGMAMHATVRYALWVRHHLEQSPEGEKQIAQGFDVMPEVREVLEEHLDITREPSLAIRAVYGQWFPWLVLLDEDWAKVHVPQIFPDNEGQRSFRDAAWETYIVFCRPYHNVFAILREQYAAAVERLGAPREEKRLIGDPEARLAEHLMILYWQGKLRINDHILQEFWNKASKELRAHALSFVGRSLHNTKGQISDQILARLKALWESRLAVAKGAVAPDDYEDEMAAFGWWFVSEKFENEWAIEQLAEALRISRKTEVDHLVAERLSALANDWPALTIQCLEKMVKGDQEGWEIYTLRDHARVILAKALQSPDPAVRMNAEGLVNYLGSRGHLEFCELLKRRDQ